MNELLPRDSEYEATILRARSVTNICIIIYAEFVKKITKNTVFFCKMFAASVF